MKFNLQQAYEIGDLLCEATEQLLWPAASQWVHARQPASILECRVGRGQATYHRFDARQQHHLITYGARMVAAKQQAETAIHWLSSREIQQHRYFDGELSTLNLLAHTCCHEFAHLLQQVAGKRLRGSVHNRHFYRLLDDLHEQGKAEEVRDFLQGEARQRSLALSATPFTRPDQRTLITQWQVGDRVCFGDPPHRKRGRILKVNKKTCTVACDPGTVRYRVPVQMLRRLAAEQDS